MPIDVPPPPEARITLPDAFGTRFALFGDAEEEFDWSAPFSRGATATDTMRALPDANARFVAAGLVPCWLADWPIVTNPHSAAVLRDLVAQNRCTVGTQLHPWVSPPFDEDVGVANSFTGNLPVGLQAAKLGRLTDRIAEAVGVRPRVYRAGRYGVGAETARLLGEHGYALDVSVRAGFDYREQGGPDFTHHPVWPWRLGTGLSELPLSTAYTGTLGRWPGLYNAGPLRGTLARARLFSRIPLTPEGVPVADALEAIEVLLGEGHRLFSLSFHTPSLVPGHTPYVRDVGDLVTFWRWWDAVLGRFAQRGVQPVGSDDIIAAFAGKVDGGAPSPRRYSEIVPLRAYLAAPDPGWSELAVRPSEPNAFAERWFVDASVRNLPVPDDARMLVVREEGQLIGLMPLFATARYGRMTVVHLQNWLHYNALFGAPLVRRAFEPFFWARALALLDGDLDWARAAFLHVVMLDADGPLAAALLSARRGAAVVHRTNRALLSSPLGSRVYFESVVRKKKRKELARLRARLDEAGMVAFARLDNAHGLPVWIDTFLALEASGWKGRDGAALGNAPGTAAFMRDALTGAFTAGRLELLRLDLDGRAIAMLVNFLTPPGSFSFKIAFDEDFARFSPGVLIQLENLKLLDRLGDGADPVVWMDSCAVEDHPMINSLWDKRRPIVRISVPLKGWRRRAVFGFCRAVENTAAQLRKRI